MQYALRIYEDEAPYEPGKKGPAIQEVVSRHMAFNKELGAKRVGGTGLSGTSSATMIGAEWYGWRARTGGSTASSSGLCSRWSRMNWMTVGTDAGAVNIRLWRNAH